MGRQHMSNTPIKEDLPRSRFYLYETKLRQKSSESDIEIVVPVLKRLKSGIVILCLLTIRSGTEQEMY